MTNSYDVLSKLHAKASAQAEKSVAEDLKKEDKNLQDLINDDNKDITVVD